MDKKTIDEEEDDFDIDELLSEDEDSPTEEVTEEIVEEATEEKKGRGRPKGSTKIKPKAKPEVPVEVANVNKELSNMEWQSFSQQAYEGFQNTKTGEIIDEREALRRTLCYAQEAARNSR